MQQHDALRAMRSNFDSLWQLVHDICWPDSGDFTIERAPGDIRTQSVYDITAVSALEKFAAVLTQRWHKLKPSVPELADDHDAMEYFEELTRILFAMRNRPGSGFADQKHEGYKSLGAYGNDCLSAMPMKGGVGISYRYTHVGSVWIEVDDRGRVDTYFVKFTLSAKAAEQKWGDQTPKCAKDVVEMRPFETHDYLHVIKPRQGYNPNLLGPKGMPLESWEISLQDHEFIPVRDPLRGTLEESSGFRTSPYIYSRYTVNPSEKHGRGPAMLTLPCNETLQQEVRTQLLAGQLAVEPPILAMDDGILAGAGSKGLSLVPSAVTVGGLDALGRPRYQTFENNYKHAMAEDMAQGQRDQINDMHMVSLFQILVDNPQMTATEALIRAQEKGQLITPTVGRQQSEMLGRMIERDLDILESQGMLPPMPEVLVEAEGEYEIEYESAATRLQKEEEIQSIRAGLSDVVPLMEIDDTVRHIVDIHAVGRHILEARGVPADLVNSKEETEAAIAAEAQVIQEEEATAAAPAMAKAARDLQAANLMPQEVQAMVQQ
jgi:hypothetical protein